MIRHYDDLSMRFGAMTQAGVLIFIGLGFGLPGKDRATFLYLFPFVIVFSGMSSLVVHLWFKRHRGISQIKIRRILEIEKELGWRQFLMVDETIKSGRLEGKPVRNMLNVLHLGLPILLVIAYLMILCCMGR